MPICLNRRFLTAAQGLWYGHVSGLEEKHLYQERTITQIYLQLPACTRVVLFCFMETIKINVCLCCNVAQSYISMKVEVFIKAIIIINLKTQLSHLVIPTAPWRNASDQASHLNR